MAEPAGKGELFYPHGAFRRLRWPQTAPSQLTEDKSANGPCTMKTKLEPLYLLNVDATYLTIEWNDTCSGLGFLKK